MNRGLSLIIVPLVVLSVYATALWPQAQEREAVSLSDSIGTEIDRTERETYHLFPDIKGFQSARIFQVSGSKYRLDYTYKNISGTCNKSRRISADALKLTQAHVELTEKYHRIRSFKVIDQNVEADILYGLALKYVSQAEYDIALRLFDTLLSEYPQSNQALEARAFHSDVELLSKSRKALFWKGSLLNQSGRTDIIVFSGYYGLWLGIATPIFLEADSPQAFALGLLLGGPLSIMITHGLTKDANINEGRATMISLGGHLGTWQGIGWAAVSDLEGHEVVGVGELCGLAGIGAATILTNSVDFGEGHASLTSSGLQWGAWFGLVFGAIADHEDDELLRDMLIGSDALILGTAIAAKNVRMSEARVRLINLAGVLGTVFGFGIDLLVEADETSTVFGIAGMGSVIGFAMGANLTKNFDKGKDMSSLEGNDCSLCSSLDDGKGWSFSPTFAIQKHSQNEYSFVPGFGFQFNF